MTTQLGVYNRALAALGARRLASTSEPREARRVLDDLYTDCVQYCLEQGVWNFAMTALALSSAGSGSMNYSHFFTKPADLVHLYTASENSSFDPPLVNDFIDTGALWVSNATTLNVRFTSNDTTNGGSLSKWTGTFENFLVHQLAAWAGLRITGSDAIAAREERKAMAALLKALAIDHVPSLPGKRPFNAEARTLPVEGHSPTPVDPTPFHAEFSAAQPPQGQPQG